MHGDDREVPIPQPLARHSGMTSGVAGGDGGKGMVLEQGREEDPGLRFRDSCHYGV